MRRPKSNIVLTLSLLGSMLMLNTQAILGEGNSEMYYKKGNKAMSNLQFELAVVYFDSAINESTSNADYFVARAQAKDFEGDEVGALEDVKTALAIQGDHFIAVYVRSLIYFKKEKYKEAAKDYTYLINAVEEFNTEMVVYKGVSFHDFGDNQIFSVTNTNEFLADVYAHRAIVYEKLGFKTSAMVDYDHALELNEHDPNYHVNRGLFRLERGDKAGAIHDYRAALKINPHHKAALYNLSFLVDDDERDEINMLLFGEGDKAMYYSKNAFELFQKGQYEEALVYYDSALNLKADNASDLMNRGIVKVKLGDHRAAIKDFSSSVYADNSLLRNYVLIGDAYQEIEDYNYAIKYYDRYLKNAGPDGKVYYALGMAYKRFSKPDQACQTFRKAIELGDERAEKPMDDVCFQ